MKGAADLYKDLYRAAHASINPLAAGVGVGRHLLPPLLLCGLREDYCCCSQAEGVGEKRHPCHSKWGVGPLNQGRAMGAQWHVVPTTLDSFNPAQPPIYCKMQNRGFSFLPAEELTTEDESLMLETERGVGKGGLLELS